jgi:hypothetical protein
MAVVAGRVRVAHHRTAVVVAVENARQRWPGPFSRRLVADHGRPDLGLDAELGLWRPLGDSRDLGVVWPAVAPRPTGSLVAGVRAGRRHQAARQASRLLHEPCDFNLPIEPGVGMGETRSSTGSFFSTG